MTIEAGLQVQHYRLIEKIGEGGMGVVWKAQDIRLQRFVAVKFVPDNTSRDAQAVDRHLREARAASSLNHPHICSIHDIGEWEGRRFLVMELLEGRTLQERIGGSPMPIDETIELAVQIADALDAAHAKGIIHRDIKSANIFVTGTGSGSQRAMVLDFGLAKLTADRTSGAPSEATLSVVDHTTPGAVVGTLSYMSPEQALGRTLDHRTDIFSLGVVLYEMITGRLAFHGETSAAVFDAILNRRPVSPAELNPQVPAELLRIVTRALEKDPDLRYQSASELRTDLKRLRRGSSSDQAPAAVRPPRAGPWIAAALVLLVGVIAVALLRSTLSRGVSSPAPVAGQSSTKGPWIAVLPFVNASGDPEQEYFSDGLTEEMVNELSRISELNVIARSSTLAYKGGPADVRRIGAELGIRYVLQGSVRRSGSGIRITARLSDADDGRQLWGDTYTRDLTATEVFKLQDELAQKVVSAIAGSYGALSRARLAETRREAPTSLDSYDCVLRAYEYLQVHTVENHAAARACLEEAVERDPDYPDAWAWLAYTYAEEYHHRRNERPDEYDALDRALEVARHAVHLDDANQVAHGVLALIHVFREEYDRFPIEADRAIAINPNNALWLALCGQYSAQLGDWEKGLPMARRALALNPNPPGWYHTASYLDHYWHGRYEEALVDARKSELHDYRTPLFRAAAHARLGRLHEARRELDEFEAQWPGSLESVREELIRRQGFAPAVADALLDGLREAGLTTGSRQATDSVGRPGS